MTKLRSTGQFVTAAIAFCLCIRRIQAVAVAQEDKYGLIPGDKIPYGFTAATINLDGSLGTFTLNESKGKPLLVHAYLPDDATLHYMWSADNKDDTAAFLRDMPEGINILFISYGLDATGDMKMLQKTLQEALYAKGKGKGEIEAKLKDFHFARDPMSGISDQGANFIPNLLAEWQSSRDVITTGGRNFVIPRLDSILGWMFQPPPSTALHVSYFGNGCSSRSPYDLGDSIALVVRDGTDCSFAEIISRAQLAKARAVIVSSQPGGEVVPMGCHGEECSLPLSLFATMISHPAASRIQELITIDKNLQLAFRQEQGPGYFAAVDSQGRLQQTGWLKLPNLQYLSWAAQWLKYQQNLQARLDTEALVIPVLEAEIMQGEHGISKAVQLPEADILRTYNKLELDFALDCPGVLDADCPIWDHIVQVFVCCSKDQTCQDCEATPWLFDQHIDDAAEANWQMIWRNDTGRNNVLKKNCGRELGRWVTPFRRRGGRWLTDVTPLRSLLSSEECSFTAQTAPWALPWKPSLNLRFSQDQEAVHLEGKAETIIPLFEGGTFDKEYNHRKHIRTATPEGTSRAWLYAVITGHGSDEFNCAEFCPTSHTFRINRHDVSINLTEAGTEWGCTKHVLQGVQPNEHGTWQYGRDGWCDGVNVPPHVFDVTDYIFKDSNINNIIEYWGFFNGTDPSPQADPGYIMMQSSLVFVHNEAETAYAL